MVQMAPNKVELAETSQIVFEGCVFKLLIVELGQERILEKANN